MKRLVLLLGFAFVVGVASADARAQDCAGFTDVSSASSFCPNVEWLKNRAITLGCTSATLYCPGDPVSRLSMAAFLNRLGKALTPLVTFVNQSPGALDLDAEPIVCQTGDLAITGYPRQATVTSA